MTKPSTSSYKAKTFPAANQHTLTSNMVGNINDCKPLAVIVVVATTVLCVTTARYTADVLTPCVVSPAFFELLPVELADGVEVGGDVGMPPLMLGSAFVGFTSHTPAVLAGHAIAALVDVYAAKDTELGARLAHCPIKFAKSGCRGCGVPDLGHPSGGAPGVAGSTKAPY